MSVGAEGGALWHWQDACRFVHDISRAKARVPTRNCLNRLGGCGKESGSRVLAECPERVAGAPSAYADG